MGEMIYENNQRSPEQLAAGTFLGYSYYVLSFGTHPCAYVGHPRNNKYFGQNCDDIPVECHGGLTYSSHKLHTVDHTGWFIGWDYAHWGDYVGYLPASLNEGNKQYTTVEMVEDCWEVILQIEYLNVNKEAT